MICELQIRTLLQDSWGELTHEDTYKPGSQLPPLVETLSKRMASLMATLDEIAQDLRDEMDRLEEQAGEDDEIGIAPTLASDTFSPDREAAYQYLDERISGLDRPIDLASLAWELQKEFGRDVVYGWLGHGSFKNLLLAAVPSARLSARPPAYVLPNGFSADDYATVQQHDGIPRAAFFLREADGGFPLVRSEQWAAIYDALARATSEKSGMALEICM